MHARPNATLLARQDVTETLATFRILPDAVPAAGRPWFLPGQYVVLGHDHPEAGDASGVLRAYSIASEPEERRWLEFYIRFARRPETDVPLTHDLWTLAPGARLHCGTKVSGRFTIEHTVGEGDPRLRVLVAAGTGIAPFASMVRAALRRKPAEVARYAVLYGASHPLELAYGELWEEARAGGLRYAPTISRAAEQGGWSGLTGRVESLFEPVRLPGLVRALGLPAGGLNPDAAVVYVCGFRGTLAGSLERLIPLGFVPQDHRLRRLLEVPADRPPSLFFEQYDLEPIVPATATDLVTRLRLAIRGQQPK